MEDKKPVYLTTEGLQRLKEELHFLRTKERARIAMAIADARAQGDLAENAEYDAAKEAQGHLEARISQLENTVSEARILDDSGMDSSKAYILSTVRVRNLQSDVEQSFTLVSSQEADLAQGKVSVTSPIGKGMLGRSVGDEIEITAPAGKIKFRILEISR